MKFVVSKDAAQWYINEMDLKQGDYVQYIVKIYGGIPTVHESYFLGISLGKEGNIAIQDVVEGITFYFNDLDAWFLEEYDLQVVMEKKEIKFIYNKSTL